MKKIKFDLSRLGKWLKIFPGKVARFLWCNLWAVALYIYLLAVVTLFSWKEDGALVLSLENLIRGIRSAFLPALAAGILRGVVVLGHPRLWRRLVAGIPTFLLSLLCFSEVWVSFMLHSRWSDRLIRLIADTNPSESGEFFERYFFSVKSLGVIFGFVVCTIAIYFTFKILGKLLRLSSSAGVRRVQQWGAVAVLLAGCFWWSLPPENNYNAENSYNSLTRLHKMISAFRKSVKNVKALELTPYLADGKLTPGFEPPENIVWVIGESDSKAHWSLYGYPLPTTPAMENLYAAGELIRYDDVICYEPRTYRMMEILFSPYVVIDSTKYYLRQPLTPMILRKAGYKVRLHDNQATLLRGDDQAEVGTCNFMNSRILSNANFDYRNEKMYRYDRELIDAEGEMIFADRKPGVDIFHINGQHFSAVNRYPEGFGKFTERDYQRKKGFSRDELRQIAEYDNATLYVDSLLSHLVSMVKDRDAIIIYHPDHGEEMNDERHCHVRTMDSHKNRLSAKYVLEVPFVVYATPLFRERRPQLWERLKKGASERQSLVYFSHFLMDLAGIESKYLKREYSPLSDEWKRPIRVVKGLGVSYDTWKRQ